MEVSSEDITRNSHTRIKGVHKRAAGAGSRSDLHKLWRYVPNGARTRSVRLRLQHNAEVKWDFRSHEGHKTPTTTYTERSEISLLSSVAEAKLSPPRIAVKTEQITRGLGDTNQEPLLRRASGPTAVGHQQCRNSLSKCDLKNFRHK